MHLAGAVGSRGGRSGWASPEVPLALLSVSTSLLTPSTGPHDALTRPCHFPPGYQPTPVTSPPPSPSPPSASPRCLPTAATPPLPPRRCLIPLPPPPPPRQPGVTPLRPPPPPAITLATRCPFPATPWAWLYPLAIPQVDRRGRASLLGSGVGVVWEWGRGGVGVGRGWCRSVLRVMCHALEAMPCLKTLGFSNSSCK
ncbi:hypothetical protein BU14_0125s0047 [Porphyra umbilicalis]|uniref:Uncharacterized protein n=1 Tax=Porphyra umbilicalis TaxID=2786 RepID=A0A1X6PAX8_PORUM|nr:hypothetical protein BU14_0125s0047 [Porphyra umbilicalis]|eukprot:OSX78059.1 hypothetical protein BU14_0125s0047 [Porphyra umbilicalis]